MQARAKQQKHLGLITKSGQKAHSERFETTYRSGHGNPLDKGALHKVLTRRRAGVKQHKWALF
eukprot:1142973-Pelagomonas_calceolata.AAC.5